MKIIVGLVLLLAVGMNQAHLEYYKAYVGIHCNGTEHKTAEDHYHETDTIESCFKACDATPDCVAFAIRDNWSIGGCYLKKESCLGNMSPKPGVTMFVKPRSIEA